MEQSLQDNLLLPHCGQFVCARKAASQEKNLVPMRVKDFVLNVQCKVIYPPDRGLCISQFQQCPSPPGNSGAFAQVVSPGGGALAVLLRARGLGICVPRGDPREFDTRVFKSVFKGMFFQFLGISS